MYINLITYRDTGGETVVDIVKYTTIKSLSFAPDADVTGNSLPIPGFDADIITTDDIHNAVEAELYDDLDQLWAQYEITYAERVDESTFHIQAQSFIHRLQYIELEEIVYEGVSASTAIAAIFEDATNRYSLHEDLEDVVITGYCPAQNARDRLAWLCFVMGAYVDATFRDTATIMPVDETETLVPLEHTFWRPSIIYDEWVTAVKVTAYTFHRGTDEELQNSSSYMFPVPWIAEEQSLTLTNPDAPATAPENIKEISGIYIVNQSNVNSILNRLAKYWFKRMSIDATVINNRAYKPGDLLDVYTGAQEIVNGHVQSASFEFGTQARSILRLTGADMRESALLTVNYMYGESLIGKAEYYLPVDYGFSIQNPYLDKTSNGHRYIYRPLTANATGIMVAGGLTVNVYFEIAIDLYNGTLYIIDVDEVDRQPFETEWYGVIT